MLEKKHNRLYLVDDNNQNEITIDLSRYYCDISLRIKSNSRKDIFIKIEDKQSQVFNSLDKCFNSINELYESEPESYKRCRYECIWFVDKYNKAITFYCDNTPLEEADAFTIRKCIKSKEQYFELAMYRSKSYSSFDDGVLLTNDYGRYTPYILCLVTLYNDLLAIAQEKAEPQVIEEKQPVIVMSEAEQEEPEGFKKLIKTLFKR